MPGRGCGSVCVGGVVPPARLEQDDVLLNAANQLRAISSCHRTLGDIPELTVILG
jgi:hypothetical protein